VESVIRLDRNEKLRRKLQLILDNCSVAIGILDLVNGDVDLDVDEDCA
jgi:hypothetical protein